MSSRTDTPDSGFSSRAETPAIGADGGSPKKDSEADREGEEEIEAEKKSSLTT